MERPIFIVAVLCICAAIINIFLEPILNIILVLSSFLILLGMVMYKKVSYFYLISLMIIPIIFFRYVEINQQGNILSNLEDKENVACIIKGYVSNLNTKDESISFRIANAVVYDLDMNKIDTFGVQVYDYNGITNDIKEGYYVELNGKISNFNSARNEGNFDMKKYYLSLNVKGKFICEDVLTVNKNKAGLKPFLQDFRNKFERTVDKIFSKRKAGVINAMTVGDRKNLDEEIKEDFKESGIAHLLSISALHVSLVGISFYKLLKRRLKLYLSGIIAGLIMCSYLILTGNSISCRRAVIMLICFMISEIIGRCNDLITTISLSAVILIYDNPFVITNTGFLLSFLAMAGIAFIYPILINEDRILIFINRKSESKKTFKYAIKKWILEGILLSLSVQIITLPVIICTNYEIPILSVFFNLVVIPLLSLVMISGFLTGFLGMINIILGTFFAGISNYILDLYFYLCHISTGIKGLVIVTGMPLIKFVFIYYGLLIFIIILNKLIFDEIIEFKTKELKVILGILCLLFTINIYNLQYKFPVGLNINMVDVGQGDCILVSLNGKNILFDGGSTDVANVGKYRIMPSLKYLGIKRIDIITVSHFDTDHVNGIIEMLESMNENFEIGKIVIPDVTGLENKENAILITNLCNEKGVKMEKINAGMNLYNKDCTITCLHPVKNYKYDDPNDYSASYLINYNKYKMLTIGDAESNGENEIVNNAAKLGVNISNINCLKVGHHGSKTSSTQKFLDATNPRIGLISCGVNNRYNHPSEITLEKLSKIKCKYYITSRVGQIKINVDKKGKFRVSTFLL